MLCLSTKECVNIIRQVILVSAEVVDAVAENINKLIVRHGRESANLIKELRIPRSLYEVYSLALYRCRDGS